ncbi:hypothetical protein NKI85_19455 [Mesorhizobium sp. M0571]
MKDSEISRRQMLKVPLIGATIAAASQSGLVCEALAQPVPASSPAPPGAFAHNVEAVGYTDLDHRPAFKMAIRQVGERWYLYTGHFWHSGWSIVDVTDPAKPETVKFVPYRGTNTWTLQIDLSGDTMVTALEKPFAHFGGDPDAPFGEGVLIWDIADPINPKQLSHYRTGGNGTHRNLYPGGRYVHLAAGMPGYRGNIYVILDVSDRSSPREAGRWWVPGQHEAGGESFAAAKPTADQETADRYRLRLKPQCMCGAFCASTGEDVSLHGPPYVTGDLVYLPYGAAGIIVLDISDVSQPRQVGGLSFSPPFHSRFGVHSVLPIPERGIAFANSENVTYGRGPMHHASIVDISDSSEPFLLSLLPETRATRRRSLFGFHNSWRLARAAQHQPPPASSRCPETRRSVLHRALQRWAQGLRRLEYSASTRGRLLHPAGASPTLRPYAGRQAGCSDRGRGRGPARLHLHK